MEKKIYIPKTIYGVDEYGCKIQLFAEGTEEVQYAYNAKANAVQVLNVEDLPEPVGLITKTSFHSGELEQPVAPKEVVIEAPVEVADEVPVEKNEEVEEVKKKGKGK